MARLPERTCPNLYRLIDGAELPLLIDFLRQDEFRRLAWLDQYRSEADRPDGREILAGMLHREPKQRLDPLEQEAGRVLSVAERRGQFALMGLVEAKLRAADRDAFKAQKDDHARSLWAYLNHRLLFEATESALHLHLYRNYGKHYQSFKAAGAGDRPASIVAKVLDELVVEIEGRLDQGKGCSIERFDLPAETDQPDAQMYIVYYPNPLKSEREVREDGERRTIYFRPPGEATIVYTPATGTIEVRADTKPTRRIVAEAFAETVLGQDLSSCPLSHREYDLSRFFTDFSLDCPEIADVAIRTARVIRAEVSPRSLGTRLSLATTIDDDLDEIIKSQSGLQRAFSGAVGIRFIEIAVRYILAGETNEKTLNFTISDQNSSSLLSLPDGRERILGHRLLRHWGILREFRQMEAEEAREVLPVLLELWDRGTDVVSGSWLEGRGVEAALLTETGFLEPFGWEETDLIDEEDGRLMDAKVIADGSRADLVLSPGQEQVAGDSGRYRMFRINQDWLVEKLRSSAATGLDLPFIETLTPDLLSLGRLHVDDRKVPVCLARRLTDEKVLAASDTALRARGDQGAGLVLSAGRVAYRCIGANVLTALADHLSGGGDQVSLDKETMRAAFRSNRHLARGGQSVDLVWDGGKTGELFVPGQGSIPIPGHNRLIVLDRLVKAYKRGAPVVKTSSLNHDLGGLALRNIFGKALWDQLEGRFVRSAGHGFWEIAA